MNDAFVCVSLFLAGEDLTLHLLAPMFFSVPHLSWEMRCGGRGVEADGGVCSGGDGGVVMVNVRRDSRGGKEVQDGWRYRAP